MRGSTQNHAVISRFCQIMCKQRGEQFNTTTLEIHHSYVDVMVMTIMMMMVMMVLVVMVKCRRIP